MGDYDMVDNGEISISMNVSGLSEPSLDAPGQGLCGVRIRFTHQLIGDVLLSLQSPSGQIIELTGPQVVTSSTSLSVFDITFIACSAAPTPDPGFSPQWDNDQPWAILGNYSGSYHPFNGCLEDLTGSAEGQWTLIAADAQGQDIGSISEIELIFCNPNGQNCIECEADAGLLEPDTFEQCANGMPIDLVLTPIFSDGPANPDEYAYFYFVQFNGVVIDVTSEVDNSNLDTGIYEICGISVLHADTNAIKSIPANLDYDGFVNFLLDLHICFDLSSDCSYLLVKPELPPSFRTHRICQGENFRWRGLDLSVSGNYLVRNNGANGCLRDHHLELIVLDPEPIIETIIPFGCDQSVSTLRGNDATFGNNVTFHWYSPDGGSIVTNPNQVQVDVVGTGTYCLITTRNFGPSNSCSDTICIPLTDNFQEVLVGYVGDTLSCLNDSVLVRSIFNLPSATIIWRNQFGEEDTARNQIVRLEDDYTVIAVSPQGCRDSAVVRLPFDTIAPTIALSDINKICLNDSILLSPGIFNPAHNYLWILPNGDSVITHELYTADVGIFTFYATADNGCTAQEEMTIFHIGTTPEFQIVSDTFYCYSDSIPIRVSSNLNEISYEITGPQNFRSTEHNVFIHDIGNYTITVETAEGCTYDTIWSPPMVQNVTTVQISGDTLDCATDSVQLSASVFGPDLRYTWRGPGNFLSNEIAPYVRENGLYTLVLRTKTGCRIDGQYEVALDTLKPNVQIEAGILNCLIDSVRFRVTEDEDAYIYNWEGPNNFQSNRKRPWAPEPGWYYTTVTKLNGCISYFSREVTTDYEVPTDTITATEITCLNLTSDVTLGTDAAFIEWSGDGFMSNLPNVTLPGLDTFSLYLRGSNGCDTLISFIPPVDTIHPVISISSDILGCNRDSVPLNLASDIELVTVLWSGPDVANPVIDSTSTTSPGQFSVIVAGQNGCESTDSLVVIEDFAIPDISIGGTPALTCSIDSILLFAQSSMSNLQYEWTLPDQTTLSDSLILNFESGEYRLTVEAPNSCRDTAYHVVAFDRSPPTINLTTDTINCVQNSATLNANLTSEEQVTWTWPDQQISFNEQFMTTLPGLYKAVVTNTRTDCVDSSTIRVIVDTASIDNDISGQARITCGRMNAQLNSDVSHQDANLQWTGPGLMESNVDSVLVSQPGTYYLRSVLSSLCFDLDSFNVVLDTVAPDIALFGDTISCGMPKVEIRFETSFSNIKYEWSGPNGFNSIDSIPFVNQGGYYVLELTNRTNGCVRTDSILIVGDTLAPSVSVETNLFSCDDTTAMATAISPDSIDQYIWLGPNSYNGMGQQVLIDELGEYVVIAFSPNGCIGQDTFNLTEFDEIDSIQLFTDSINCYHPLAVHFITTREPNVLISWYEGNIFASNNDSLFSSFDGNVQVVIENARGCTWDSMFQVQIDTMVPNPVIEPIGEIKCASDNIELLLSNLSTSNTYEIDWSTAGGSIVSGDSNLITVGDVGFYSASVLNVINGCEEMVEIEIIEGIDSLRINELIVTQPHCNNNYFASIEIGSISGASGEVLYSINNEIPTSDGVFSNLPTGLFIIEAIDEFGCKAVDSASIDDIIIRFVDIERDTIVKLGEYLQVDPVDNFTSDLIHSKNWTVNGELLCDSCDRLNFQPTISGYYTLTIVDTNGCLVADSIFVNVVSTPSMFIPDAFSPNRDSRNDKFGPYFGSNVRLVHDFTIFTRWGEIIHQRKLVLPDDENLFWNGRAGGQFLNPGVFVYTIQVELIDGRIISRQGDFHLIR